MYYFAAITATLLIGTISYLKWKLTYWKKIGLPTLKPVLLFGDISKLLLGKVSFGDQFLEIYKRFISRGLRHGGIYMGTEVAYVPLDPEIIKHILQNDFSHFVNHGVYVDEDNDPLSATLFGLEDAKWRHMRVKLTPTFTSGKLKMMFQTLVDCTVGLKTIMDDAADKKEVVEIKDILARFTTDIIGSVAFGIECNSLRDPECEFRKYGKKVFQDGLKERIKTLMLVTLPMPLLKVFKFKVTKTEVEDFYMKVVKDTVDYREANNVTRKDFMQLLMQLKNDGVVPDDDESIAKEDKGDGKGLTMNQLTAQAFVFFVAGFETSSTTMTFAVYELATNPHIQDKLRQEINSVLKKHDDQITYAAMMEMTYMEKVINETLRKYPPLGVLFRKCCKDYTVPQTKIHIKKGVAVMIPVLGIHTDPKYYPDPEVFDPERFSEENKNSRPPFTWLPFGEGPRICIGLRFGILQTKVGLTALLKNYKISLNEKTKLPLRMDKRSFITSVEGGVWIDVEEIK